MADRSPGAPGVALGPSEPPPRRWAAGPVVAIGAVTAVAFAALTVLVAAGRTQAIDDRAATVVSDPLREQLIRPTKVALHLLDPRLSIALALIAGTVAFVLTTNARHLAGALALVGIWGALTIALKAGLDRSLPNDGDGAYPSGHVGGAVVLGAVVALALVALVPTGRWRRAAVVLLVAAPIVLAALLVATGGHWLSDVVGGALLAVACVAAVELLLPIGPTRRGRATPPVDAGPGGVGGDAPPPGRRRAPTAPRPGR